MIFCGDQFGHDLRSRMYTRFSALIREQKGCETIDIFNARKYHFP